MNEKHSPKKLSDLPSGGDDQGIVREFVDFLRHSKKWWLLPILLLLLTITGFMVLTSSAAAPFIYALF